MTHRYVCDTLYGLDEFSHRKFSHLLANSLFALISFAGSNGLLRVRQTAMELTQINQFLFTAPTIRMPKRSKTQQ